MRKRKGVLPILLMLLVMTNVISAQATKTGSRYIPTAGIRYMFDDEDGEWYKVGTISMKYYRNGKIKKYGNSVYSWKGSHISKMGKTKYQYKKGYLIKAGKTKYKWKGRTAVFKNKLIDIPFTTTVKVDKKKRIVYKKHSLSDKVNYKYYKNGLLKSAKGKERGGPWFNVQYNQNGYITCHEYDYGMYKSKFKYTMKDSNCPKEVLITTWEDSDFYSKEKVVFTSFMLVDKVWNYDSGSGIYLPLGANPLRVEVMNY